MCVVFATLTDNGRHVGMVGMWRGKNPMMLCIFENNCYVWQIHILTCLYIMLLTEAVRIYDL